MASTVGRRVRRRAVGIGVGVTEAGPPIDGSGRDFTGTGSTMRVSVREVREAAEWSLRAAGVDGGNSRVAAEAVVAAEVGFAAGLDGLVRSLRLLDGLGRAPAHPTVEEDGTITATDDMAVLIHFHRMALAVATRSGPTSLHVVGPAWHPCLVGVLMGVVGRRRSGLRSGWGAGLVAVGRGTGGGCVGWVSADGIGVDLVEGGEPPPPVDSPPVEAGRASDHQAVVVALMPGPAEDRDRHGYTWSELERRHRTALGHGLRVDRAYWLQVSAWSRRYLVPTTDE